MPEIVAFAAGRTDKKLALMQLEQLAEEIVGIADVAGMINERGKGGIALDDILAAEGLPRPVFGAGLTNAIDRSREFVDRRLVEGVFKEEDPLAVEGFPLVVSKARWDDAVGWNRSWWRSCVKGLEKWLLYFHFCFFFGIIDSKISFSFSDATDPLLDSYPRHWYAMA